MSIHPVRPSVLVLAASILASSGCRVTTPLSQPQSGCKGDLSVSDLAYALGITSSTARERIAQTFTVNDDLSIDSIQLNLFAKLAAGATFAASDRLVLKIYEDSGITALPEPRTIQLADSELGVVSGVISALGSNAQTPTFVTFKLDRSVSLEKGRTYWVTVEGSYSASGTKYIYWAASRGSTLEGGASYSSASGSMRWNSEAGRDLNFRFGCS